MVPVIHALGQVAFSKLFTGFLVSQLQKRLLSGVTAMQTDLLQKWKVSLSVLRPYTTPHNETSKAVLAGLIRLFFEACFCT